MTDTRRARASRQNLPRLQGIMRHPPECCDPARYLFRLKGLMINNGDAIGRLKALLHLRGAHKGSSRRERVDGDLLRLRGIMTDTRRVRARRQNLPRLQEIMGHPPERCDPARYLFRLKGLMISNGEVIGRLEVLLHLRGEHEGSSRRERVDGDLLRLRGA